MIFRHWSCLLHRVRTGRGKPGKLWKFRTSFSRPGKPLKLSVCHVCRGKSWKMKFIVQNIFSRPIFL